MPRTTTRDEIKSFDERAAGQFAAFATQDSLSQTSLKANLTRVGIKAEVVATCDHLKITVTVPEFPGLAVGEKAEDLTDAAKERRAQDYLKARKAAVWTAVKSMAGTSSLKTERATEVLKALGYGSVSLPTVKTSVSAEIARGRNEGYDEVSFTLDGEHSKDEITAALTAQAALNPAEKLVLAAFSGAVLPESRQPVRRVQVHSELTWPAKSEFHAA